MLLFLIVSPIDVHSGGNVQELDQINNLRYYLVEVGLFAQDLKIL